MILGSVLIATAAILIALAVGSADRAAVGRRTGSESIPRSHGRVFFQMPGLGWRWWPLVGAAAGASLGGVVPSLLGGVVAAVVVATLRRRRGTRLSYVLNEQLADAVRSIAAGMRAGLSVPQSIAYAAREADPPLARSFERVADQMDLGQGLEGALQGWATDVDTDDARLIVGVLGLHRRSGGDLPVVLDHVAATLGERVSAAREVRALTAQARLSGAILGLLPIGFFAFLWLTSRSTIEGSFRSSMGVVAIVVGLLLEGVAFLWIRSLLEVD